MPGAKHLEYLWLFALQLGLYTAPRWLGRHAFVDLLVLDTIGSVVYNPGMITTEERLTRLEAVYTHLATKADIADLRADIARLGGATNADIANLAGATKAELGAVRAEIANLAGATKADIGAVRAEIANLRTEFKTEIADVRTDIAQLEARLIKWMVGSVASAAVIAGSAVFVVLRIID